ncbi:RmlC-like cupin domain-containing protein [Podospora didyma]|uniref:RmlC-like cupin domain-containing protein n=1 Tax=Podospora didyma TaxID=330526 RepID=A0AAE0KL49_9PEZI|nr:RmlC-like cupin domain-containing protein [Podospora didyma]
MSDPAQILKPSFPVEDASRSGSEAFREIQNIMDALELKEHAEGGYYVETDRDSRLVPSPFLNGPASKSEWEAALKRPGFDPKFRNASTTIFYLLTPNSPQCNFHRTRARSIHTVVRGRGRYVVLHANETEENCRVATFAVGHNVAAGEKLQWIVEGGAYKASFLLPDQDGGLESSGGLLISETLVPGFEVYDHDFLDKGGLKKLVGEQGATDLGWLVRRERKA